MTLHARTARLRALADACDAEAAAEIRRDLTGRGDDDALATAAAIGAAYPALRAAVVGRFDAVIAIAREGWRAPRKRADYLRRLLAACGGSTADHAAVRRGLRRATTVERVRIALRELDPDVEVDATSREWSDLAEAQLEIALGEARTHVESRFGAVRTGEGGRGEGGRGEGGPGEGGRNGFAVIGLGKLGGGELNAGSDVDVMFVHETDEPADDDVALRPFDAFTKIARRLVATIDDHDEDGFCARVDLRLRPEGAGGPLVNSIATTIGYYETFGRGWERAALLRARPVAGDVAVGTRALVELAPFVYRRAVDPNVALEMIEMARRSRAELSDAPARDLKLGPGGIREAEFFVQTLQLIWGGRDAAVRSTNTLEGARRLRARGYITDREARGVIDGYLLLRKVEHRVQLASGVQTHLLPAEGAERDRIARSLGYKSGRELWAAIERVRSRIAERFVSLAPGRAAHAIDERVASLFQALDAPSSDADRSDRGELLASLRALARRPDAPLGDRTRERHPRFARSLVGAILDAADPELAATVVRGFFDRLAAPSVEAYVRALEADARALSRLVGLCGSSAYLGGMLVGHPELADALLFSAKNVRIDDGLGPRILAEEVAHLTHADRSDPEAFVGALRRAKGVLELAVGLADLGGELDTREASRALSSMAEATVEAAATFALEEAARRRSLRGSLAGLAVLAMGKLGGREIGYGSDLDVVFVYDPGALEGTGIDRMEAPEIYGWVAARVIRLIATPHPDGPGYDLDTRLRPSGEQGHLVVSLDAFRAYHLGGGGLTAPRGADWERQALLRLRACAGDRAVGEAVAAIADEAAFARGAPLPEQIHRLRTRLEEEIARERPGRYDIKLGRGGLADIEFAVQYLQMLHGIRGAETLAAIDAVEAPGHLRPALATVLRDGYRFLRRLEQRARVVHGAKAALLDEGAPGLAPLARGMGFRDSLEKTASESLMATYREVTSEVRAAFLEILAPPEN